MLYPRVLVRGLLPQLRPDSGIDCRAQKALYRVCPLYILDECPCKWIHANIHLDPSTPLARWHCSHSQSRANRLHKPSPFSLLYSFLRHIHFPSSNTHKRQLPNAKPQQVQHLIPDLITSKDVHNLHLSLQLRRHPHSFLLHLLSIPHFSLPVPLY